MFTHIIYAIFFWHLVHKTADCFNNIVFILMVKISSKKVCKKMEYNSTLEKVLLVCKQERRAAGVSKSNFWFQSGFSQKDEKEKFDNSEKFAEKSSPFFFVLFVCRCWHLSCQISIESVRKIIIWTYLWQCCISNFSQYYNNLHFYWAIINWNFIWNIVLNNSVYCNSRNKSACLNTILWVLLWHCHIFQNS